MEVNNQNRVFTAKSARVPAPLPVVSPKVENNPTPPEKKPVPLSSGEEQVNSRIEKTAEMADFNIKSLAPPKGNPKSSKTEGKKKAPQTASTNISKGSSSEVQYDTISSSAQPEKSTAAKKPVVYDSISSGSSKDTLTGGGGMYDDLNWDKLQSNAQKWKEDEIVVQSLHGEEESAQSNEPAAAVDADSIGYNSTKALEGTEFSSTGDPHEVTGDGNKFDNQKVGDFIKLQSSTGDLVLQSRQTAAPNNSNVKYNTAIALKVEGEVITYDAKDNDKIKINGKEYRLKPGVFVNLPRGAGKLTRDDNGDFTIETKDGDVINLKRKMDGMPHLDISGNISSFRRNGEVRGSLGTFDTDENAANDMVDRNGQAVTDLDKFLEGWRVKKDESLF